MGRNRPKRLGEKLRHIREALGVSRREMAARLSEQMQAEVPRCMISRWEKETREPNLLVLLAYARVANVTMEQIIDDDLDLPLERV